MSTLIRRRKNRLERIKDDSGVWMEGQEDLKAVVVAYFKDLFTDRSSIQRSMNLPNFFPPLLEDEARDLNAQVDNSAIKDCLFAIGPLKAPGIDGFPALFFQHCWNECANDVTASVQHCFQHNRIPPGMNETLITLLPKVPNPISMNQIRPISLCTTMYKVVSKLLVCKLRPIMEKIISPNQVSFVPGRHITDNIVIAQEVLHKFKLAKGKNGFLAWKIDLSKAYDRLSWGFIAYTLSEIGIGGSLLQLILSCISSVSFRAIVNGELSDAFQPGCGIRQGDPLSPYLFVICMEKLSHLITHEVNEKRWKSVKVSRGGPGISHLFFADDLLVFTKATATQAKIVKSCIDKFCALSGEVVNFEKSKLFVSPNTGRRVARKISRICGSNVASSLGTYLGVPLLHKRVNKATYQYVVDKVQRKLSSWKSKMLSMAGRLTLIKSVASAIPVYTMQTASIPISICNSLDKINRNFLWGNVDDSAKPHLVSWNKVCSPMIKGGLGIKKAKQMNRALLAKSGWRLLCKDNGLWANMCRKKYLKHGDDDLLKIKVWNGASFSWRSISHGVETLLKGLKWRIGNGLNTKFWHDIWVGNDSLINCALPSVQEFVPTLKVADFIENGSWNVDKLSLMISPQVIQHILCIPAALPRGGNDSMIWSGTNNGVFSVKSGYLMNFPNQDSAVSSWAFIWKIKLPPKVKCFLWILSHGKLLTNEQRFKRHMSDNTCCQICNSTLENMSHVFSSCHAATWVWRNIYVPHHLHWNQFDSFLGCVEANLNCNDPHVHGLPWNLIFAVALWFIWKWRCCTIFCPNFIKPPNPNKYILEYSSEWLKANVSISSKHNQVQVLLAWVPPPSGTLKLNVDGARLGSTGEIGSGGLIRDWNGIWITGFIAKKGIGDVLHAELWALFYGLKIAKSRNFSHLIVEVDSAVVVSLIQDSSSIINHPLYGLVSECRSLILENWCGNVQHVLRERNFAADKLAKLGLNSEMEFQELVEPPSCLLQTLSDDCSGVTTPRLVFS